MTIHSAFGTSHRIGATTRHWSYSRSILSYARSISRLPCTYSYLRHHALPVHRLRPHLGSQPCSYSYLPCLYSYLRHHALPVHRLRRHLGSQPSLSHPSRRRSCLRRRILLQVNARGDDALVVESFSKATLPSLSHPSRSCMESSWCHVPGLSLS